MDQSALCNSFFLGLHLEETLYRFLIAAFVVYCGIIMFERHNADNQGERNKNKTGMNISLYAVNNLLIKNGIIY